MNEHPLHGQPWYREPWPWILMAGPVAAVVAGLVTAWIAVANDDPLVVDNYYKEGLAINRTLARDDAAARAACRAQLLFADDGSRVRVHLTGDAPARLRLALIHPTRAGLDRTVELHSMQAGWYEGVLDLAPSARWRVLLEDSQRTWRLKGEWRPQEGGALALEPRS
jgi:hypothetical protein